MQGMFERSGNTMYEICDYMSKIYPKIRAKVGDMSLSQCDTSMGFNGVDAPLRLIEKVSKHMGRWGKPNAVILNGDFVGHGRALGR